MIQQNGIRAFGTPSKRELLLFDKVVILQRSLDEECERDNTYLESRGVVVRETLDHSEAMDLLEVVLDELRFNDQANKVRWRLGGILSQLLCTHQKGIEEIISSASSRFDDQTMRAVTSNRSAELEKALSLAPRRKDMADVTQLIGYGVFLAKLATLQERLEDSEQSVLDCTTRFSSILARKKYGDHLTSVVRNTHTFGPSDEGDYTDRAFEVVLSKFPMPTEITPLEDIMAFRSDSATQTSLLAFRHWLNTKLWSDTPVSQLDGEIEYLMHAYAEYMSRHKIKYRFDTVRAVTTLPFSLLEGVAKFKLRNAVDSLFKVFEPKIAFQQAELSAPGRDLSYLVLSEERFGQD